MKTFFKWFRKLFLLPLLLLFISFILAIIVAQIVIKPSNDRNWSTDQAILPYAEINGNLVHIHNIRNFSYKTTKEYTPAYYDKVFDVDKIKNVYFVIEPFSGIAPSAHTLLSFEFEGNQFVSISVEIRKEKGESFSPVRGLFNQYELMYVIADERDVIKLRSNYRKDKVYVYPIKTTKEKIKIAFLDMVTRANTMKDNPEFYNTLTNTCITNIVSHVNKITPKKVPFSLKVLFPKNADKLAYDLGMIDTNLSFEEARAKFLINERAEKHADSPDFSLKIREVE